MRKFSLIGSLALASLITLYACTLDSTPEPSKTTGDVSIAGDPSGSPAATADDELLGTTSDALAPASCFVTLNFCDGSGAIGTDCTETGCSLSQAISVCKSIVSDKGCAQHCNAVMRNSGGTIISTWRFTCGSTCCSEGTSYCGPTGACCDGVHFNSACPPL
jgi:hypothetical protein